MNNGRVEECRSYRAFATGETSTSFLVSPLGGDFGPDSTYHVAMGHIPGNIVTTWISCFGSFSSDVPDVMGTAFLGAARTLDPNATALADSWDGEFGDGGRQIVSWRLARVSASSPDGDADGMPDAADNCPSAANADQRDSDFDGIGNVCDSHPIDPLISPEDARIDREIIAANQKVAVAQDGQQAAEDMLFSCLQLAGGQLISLGKNTTLVVAKVGTKARVLIREGRGNGTFIYRAPTLVEKTTVLAKALELGYEIGDLVVSGLADALKDASGLSCGYDLGTMLSSAVQLIIDPPDARFREVPRLPAVTGAAAPSCSRARSGGRQRCRRLQGAIHRRLVATARAAGIQRARAIAVNRALTARSENNLEGELIQRSVLRVLSGQLADAIEERTAARRAVIPALKALGIRRIYLPAKQVQRSQRALRDLRGVPRSVIQGLIRDRVLASVAQAKTAIRTVKLPRPRTVDLFKHWNKGIRVQGLRAEHAELRLGDLLRLTVALERQGVLRGQTRNLLAKDIENAYRACSPQRRVETMRAFTSHSRPVKNFGSFLQAAAKPLTVYRAGLSDPLRGQC